MKTALAFFGAFNPPTLAHLAAARAAAEQTGTEPVIFIPSRSVYIRGDQGKDKAWPDEARLAMLKKLSETRPWMAVSDIELKQDRQPRSYDTLCRLREGGVRASLLMGSDKLRELEHGWLHVEEIAREFGIVCVSRGEDDCAELLRQDPYLRALSPYIRLVTAPEEIRSVSSTRARRLLAEDRDPAGLAALLPEEILPLLKEG